MRRYTKYLLIGMTVFVILPATSVWWWANQPLQTSKNVLELTVDEGDSAEAITRKVVAAGVQNSPTLLGWWLSWTGQSRNFKEGSYEIRKTDTPAILLRKLVRGEFGLRKLRIGEGWNIRQVRAALRRAEGLKHASAGMSEDKLLQELDLHEDSLEGMSFPDTYKYARNTSDLDILRLASQTMQRKLEAAWQSRASDLPLQTPYDLLKLASIVEKETGHGPDRPLVAAAMVNRLKINMRLQTDPTVIYGMGERYNCNITRADLQRDTPYNTYTRAGLPPTPIAMPSEAALAAAANPADSNALYFVARGDGTGSSEFSDNLPAHNRAVQKFILKKQ